jgi:hypothetical protein
MSAQIERQIVMPLLQAALLGSDHLQFEDVETIIEALTPFCEQYDEISFAMSDVRTSQHLEGESVQILTNLVQRNENNWCAKAMLACLYFRMGNRQWKALTNEILKSTQDVRAHALVKAVLSEAKGV